ncbi:CHASE3 domain-containing protein [Roseateles cellulosilyticus]|uniref:CHASE3 domain-containing protein n=1 Tax=Pelomonas cellulosilytica TaxID=2906762 RepID=A0ABS8Y111_9BURK|nr:CHASE3 domain-containing protein [Pelomonas sp. P8]MCE4557260.1 CHASE3 domain-containing protein [Pelomonas sp. P8]
MALLNSPLPQPAERPTVLRHLDPWLEGAARNRGVAVVLAAVAAAAVMGVSEAAFWGADQALAQSQARHVARDEGLRLRELLTNAETAQRGFLLTGRDDYLAPVKLAERELPAVLKSLRGQYESSDWAALVQDASLRANEKLSELQLVIKLYREGNTPAWQGLVESDIGREKMQAVRDAVAQLDRHELAQIAQERDAVYRSLTWGRLGVHGLTLLSLFGLAIFLRRNEALHKARRQHADELALERDRLDREVARRTAELTELARHLQTVREDERARLARELHDELGALLTAAKLDVARIRRMTKTAVDIDERLKHMSELLDQGIALKRRIIEDLRPSALSNLGLVPALEILTQEFEQRSGLQLSLELNDAPSDEADRLALYRLVQEALTNILRHAKARHVRVSLGEADGWLQLHIRDDGQGFNPEAVGAGHHGLLGMRYRIESLGGTLQLLSAPGRGTLVLARLPYRAPPPAEAAAAPDADTPA